MVTDLAARSGPGLDRLEAVFDDERVVANAGVLLPATLAERLGVEALVDATVLLAERSAGSRAGAKVLSLVHAMLLGADSIDDCEVLRSARRVACSHTACSRRRRLGRSCAASRSGMYASSTVCSLRRSAVPGGPVPGRARVGLSSMSTRSWSRSTATRSRARATATRASSATTRSSPCARTRWRRCTSAA